MITLSLLLFACSPQAGPPVVEAPVAVVVDALPYYDSPEFTPRWHAGAPDGFHRVAPFSLTNQLGATIDSAVVAGHPVVASFFFTSCGGICPELTENMARIDAAAPPAVVLLSHSVTPDKDTVAVLRGFARKHEVDSSRWHFLTGPRDEIYTLGRQSYFVEENLGEPKGPDDFLHTENIVLVDGEGHIRGVYNGLNKTAVDTLIQDLATLAG